MELIYLLVFALTISDIVETRKRRNLKREIEQLKNDD